MEIINLSETVDILDEEDAPKTFLLETVVNCAPTKDPPLAGMRVDDDDAPIMALVGKPLHLMTADELHAHLKALQEYIAQPALRQRDLRDAQTRIITGSRPKRSTLNVQSLL